MADVSTHSAPPEQPAARVPLPQARITPRGKRAQLRRASADLQGWATNQANLAGRVAARCVPMLCAILFVGAAGVGLGMVLGAKASSSHRGHWQMPTFEYQDIQLQLDHNRRMMQIQEQPRVDIEAMQERYSWPGYQPSLPAVGLPGSADAEFGVDVGLASPVRVDRAARTPAIEFSAALDIIESETDDASQELPPSPVSPMVELPALQ